MSLLPPLRLTRARVLRDGEMQDRSVAIADGRITKGPLPEVDLSGYLILPGIVDLHSDALERHLLPRPPAAFPAAAALAAAEREAAAAGVTTVWLAQGWSWEGGIRAPEAAERVLQAHQDHRAQAVVDLRVQLRCETHLVDGAPRLLAAVRRYGIDYVTFNDHVAEVIDAGREAPARVAARAERLGVAAEEYLAAAGAARVRAAEVPRHLCRLAEAFDRMGVVYASHDDPDGETRERFAMIGAKLAEFPATRRAAATARAMGDPVILGAPNVLRGRSHSGRVSALDLLRDRLCDALASDYHPPSLAAAAWKLVDSGRMGLPQAWTLLSRNPARVLRLPDRGEIATGRRADLVIVNERTRAIEATIAGGRLAYLAGEAGRRFLSAPAAFRLAAE
ncbi:alpha-D-ribose 1-methylphosphonate 5-triphosphate diphosphatase [Palleronia sp. KMU-117]|uniref:alpha-D-ribose 1-methylphosphonate 5-triphosphate diphosphatase n=1 Tax=Palleronia sp. KMU-117 TaxID=3434108 RepID=UPI003D70CC07